MKSLFVFLTMISCAPAFARVIQDSGAYSNDFTTKWMSIQDVKVLSLHLVLSGTASGSVSVQRSNSPVNDFKDVANGVSDSDSTLTISGDDSLIWDISGEGARWIRLSASNTGSGSYNLSVQVKEK